MRRSATCTLASLFRRGFVGLCLTWNLLPGPGPAQAQRSPADGQARSFFPPACTVLSAQNSTARVREDAPDTARLQQALDRCPEGEAVELAPGLGTDAFLSGPIHLPGGVTLLVDAGVSLLGSRRPADYASGALPTPDAPCGGPCRPLLDVASGATQPAALAGFGIVDARGGMPLIEDYPVQRTWFDLAPGARPTLLAAGSALSLNRITLRDAPADAVRFQSAGALLVEALKIVSAQRADTRGIVVENPAATFRMSGSAISVGGADLVLPPGMAPDIDGLRLYAGTGILPAAPGHNGCVAAGAPAPRCLPAVLPSADGQLFLSNGDATNLRQAAQTGPAQTGWLPAPALTLHAVLISPALESGSAADPVAFFDGPAPLGEARPHGTVADLVLPALSVGTHLLSAVSPGVSFAPVEVTVQEQAPAMPDAQDTLSAGPGPNAGSSPAQLSAPFVLSATRTTVFSGEPFLLSALGFPADATGTVTFTRDGVTLASLPVASTAVPQMVAFGDSITSGFRLSAQQAYPAVVAAAQGMTLSNLAQPGIAACDLMTGQILPNGAGPTATDAPLYTLMAGANDAYSAAPEAAFILCEQAAIAWLAIPRESKVLAGDRSVETLSPAWQYTAGNNFGLLRNSSGGGSVRLPIASTGNPIYVWYLLDNQAPGTFNVYLDGGANAAAEVALPLPGVNSASGTGVALLRISAAAGQHTIEIVAESGAVSILGVGSPPAAGAPRLHPTVLVGDVPNQNTAGPRNPAGLLAQLSLDAQQNAATLAGDGLDVRFVATRGAMLGTPAEMADDVHPNALGQTEIASAFNAALSGSGASYTATSGRGVAASLTLQRSGVQVIEASYSGDAVYGGSQAAPIAISVLDGSTVTTLAVSAAAVAFHTPVTLTATILPVEATGRVTFYDADSLSSGSPGVLGQASVANGIAALTLTLAQGTHTISATLVNSDGRQPSTSVPLPVVVELPLPTLTLTPATQRMVYGRFAPLLASVLGGDPASPPTGTVTFADAAAGALGQRTLVNGQASFPVSGLSPGLHTLTAVYAGDSGNAPASGPAVSVEVLPAPTVPYLSTPTPSPSFGEPVSVHVDLLTAGTPPSPALPASFSGDLNRTSVFMGDSITAWWPLPLNNRGIAGQTAADMSLRFAHDVLGQGFERVILLAGTNDILHSANDAATTLASIKSMTDLAMANGIRVILCTLPPMDGAGSAENTRVLALNAALTAFAQGNGFPLVDYYAALLPHSEYLGDGIHPDARGEALMETQLARTLLVPGGSVSLAGGASATLSATGTADLSVRDLPVGPTTLSVAYSGDASFQAGSATLPVVVGQAASATRLQAEPLVGYSGSAAVLRATVSNSTALPSTGAVRFSDGATPIGSATLAGDGTASLTTAHLGNGTHSFTAAYAGDTHFAASSSVAVPIAVRYLDTSVALSSAGVSFLYGAPVMLSATISAASATGTITFLDGSTVLAQRPAANGGASFTVATLTPGGHSLIASYNGDSFDSPATSPVLAISVNLNPTTLSLQPLPASVAYGQALVATASILPADASGLLTLTDRFTPPGATPTTETLGSATLAGGSAGFSLATPGVGTHVLTASYGGDPTHVGSSSAATTVNVLPDASTTVLSSSAASAAYGTPVSFAVQVSPATATGSIILRDALGGTLAQLPLVGGEATWSSTSLSPGVHAITAAYTGDAVTGASVSAATTLTVTLAPSTVTLAPLPATQRIGHPLTLSADVTPRSATGNVLFRDASLGTLGQAAVVGGVASLTLGNLPAGSYSIAAAYRGDSFDQPSSSASAALQVSLNPSSVSLGAMPASAPFGTSLALTATVIVTQSGSASTGLIQFFDGTASLGSAIPVNGVASMPLPALAPGSHGLRASFTGDALNAASSSPIAALTITPDNTVTTLTLAQAQVPAGLPVVFNVQVTSTVGALPSGTVTIRLGGRVLALATLAHGSGTSAYATVSADSGSLGLGSFTAAAFYAGDADDTLSDSSGSPVSFAIVATPTTTALALSASRVPVQTATTLTATVLSTASTATGTVTFLSNGVALATVPLTGTGTASTTLPAQGIGSYTLTVTYAPTGLFAGSSAAAQTLTVTAPLAVAFTAGSVNAAPNSTTDAALAITPLSGFTGSMAAQCASTASFLHCTVDAPASVTGPANAVVHVTVPATLAANAGSRALGSTLAAGLLLVLPLAGRRRLRTQLATRLMIVCALTALPFGLGGCATGGNFNTIPTGAQTVTVTVTAAGVTTKAAIIVNVGP